MKRILIIGGGAALAYMLFIGWKKKQALDNLDLALVGVRPSFQGSRILINCDVRLTNKTATALEVNGIAGSLFIGSTLIGNVVTTLPKQIPAYQAVVVPLTLTVTGESIANTVIDFISNRAVGAVDFVFSGSVNYLGASIPIQLTYKLS